ncbi:MAG: phosphate acyltransferase PlsX [Synergistaceae bacterium]|jgi:glycerol-3-phosphate acyltransferase PlsX|nr:phosphate acyltransferase PlsX [Synergistaceae bacterium]
MEPEKMQKITIALDAMGGDNAPHEICKGAILACREHADLEIVLTGDEEKIKPCLSEASSDVLKRIRRVHAAEAVSMDEQPTAAIRRKRDSSMRVAMEMVRAGEAQGCLSAGNTGAIVAGGVLVVGRLPAIDRPALGVPLPTINRWTFLLDVGASVRSRPLNLCQYARMGNVYSKKILGVAEPEVALLSNGTEEIKGDEVVAEAREMLMKSSLNFRGYVEGDDVPWGRADVVVCDGFMGNVILKFGEGLMQGAKSIIEEEMGHRFMPRIGVLFMIPMARALWARFNYEKYGGTPLLGVRGTVVKAHGRSKAPAILGALSAARNFIIRDGVGQIREELE